MAEQAAKNTATDSQSCFFDVNIVGMVMMVLVGAHSKSPKVLLYNSMGFNRIACQEKPRLKRGLFLFHCAAGFAV